MASSSGKMSLAPGTCTETAADFSTVDQELYDYQMHTKMCKKIAQLTKVIYSLNAKNEEQEATLQTFLRVSTDTPSHLQPTASQDEEEESAAALRNRLLELQATVAEVEECKQRAEVEHAEHVAVLTQEATDLRRNYHSIEIERDRQCRLLKQIQEENKFLEQECQHLRQAREEDQRREEDERKRREAEERKREGKEKKEEDEKQKKAEEEWEKRLHSLRETLKSSEEERKRSEEEWRVEREEMRRKIKALEEENRGEQEAASRAFQQSLNEHKSQWQKREQENCKYQNSVLQQRLKKAEAELEIREQGLCECKRQCSKLQAKTEYLEEQLENGHHRVAEAEKIVRKAEEELAVAKERLLLQENELQSKSEELLSQSSSQIQVSAEVEELRSQLSRLNIRNKELELQNSGRSNDHARMLKQHADALSSMRLELQRAHAEEMQRLHQEVEQERRNNEQELQEEKKHLQRNLDKEKVRLKEQLLKALEELNHKHGSELRQTHALLDTERKQAEEQRKTAEEERRGLEADREELQKQLQLSVMKIKKLEEAILSLEKENEEAKRREEEREEERERERALEEEKKDVMLQLLCVSECDRLKEEVEEKQRKISQMQEELALEKEQLQAEIASLMRERGALQQSHHSVEERLRLQFEKHFSDHVADLQKDREKEIRDIHLQWQHRIDEMQMQMEEKKTVVQKSTVEEDALDRHASEEMQRTKLEIQKTREMNISLRAQLHATIQEKDWLMKKQHLEDVQEENEEAETAPDVTETDSGVLKCEKCGVHQQEEELLRAERANHQRALQALQTLADEELQTERQHLHTQYKLQLEKQKAELTQQHTEWVRQVTQRHMQQILDLQNELQTHTEMMALQQDLKQQNKVQSLERQLDERSSEVQELRRENEELRERINTLNKERETPINHKHTSSSSWKEGEDEYGKNSEVEEEESNGRSEATKKEQMMEIQSMFNLSSSQTQLQARIIALETKLREREEKGKRRLEDLQTISKLKDKLNEQDQLINRLVEDLHHLSQHPPLSRDGTVTAYNARGQQGSLTTPIKKKVVEDAPQCVTSIPNLFSVEGVSTKTLQSVSRPVLQPQAHSEGRTSVRLTHLSGSPDLPHRLHLSNSKHNRTPSEQRVIETGPDGQDPHRQEWFTKYFSF